MTSKEEMKQEIQILNDLIEVNRETLGSVRAAIRLNEVIVRNLVSKINERKHLIYLLEQSLQED